MHNLLKTQLFYPAVVQTLPTSFYAYEDILERRPNHKPTDYLFAPQYENRRTAMRYISNMFKQLLIELKMQKGKLGEERTLYSLRKACLEFRIGETDGKTAFEKTAKSIRRDYIKTHLNNL